MEGEGLEDLVTCVVTSGGLMGSSDQHRISKPLVMSIQVLEAGAFTT